MTPSASKAKQKRAAGIWWLVILLLGLAVMQIVSALRVLSLPDYLAAHITVPIIVDFIAGLVWTLLFLRGAVTLIRARPLAFRGAMWTLVGFIAYSIMRLLLFAQADYDRQRLPFLLITLLISAIMVAGLRRHPQNGER